MFSVPGTPDWIAVHDDVWISNKPKDSVTRLRPSTNTVAATVTVGKRPCSGLAAEFGSLWVPSCEDQTLTRLDLKTGAVTATIPCAIGDSEGSIAAGAGSIWIVTDKRRHAGTDRSGHQRHSSLKCTCPPDRTDWPMATMRCG